MATIAELVRLPCAEPALVFPGAAAHPRALLDTPDQPFMTRPVTSVGASLSVAGMLRERLDLRLDTRVELVRKSARNAFGGMITVGRTANNDVVIDAPGVSKVHCTFTLAGGQWGLTDSASSNGTFLDGVRLPARERRALADGSDLIFGEVVAVFVLPATLASLLAPFAVARPQ